jgi:hypothetical protein
VIWQQAGDTIGDSPPIMDVAITAVVTSLCTPYREKPGSLVFALRLGCASISLSRWRLYGKQKAETKRSKGREEKG